LDKRKQELSLSLRMKGRVANCYQFRVPEQNQKQRLFQEQVPKLLFHLAIDEKTQGIFL